MAARKRSNVKGPSSKPKGKKTTSVRTRKKSGLAGEVKKSGIRKKPIKAEKLWWQAAKRNRVVVVLALLSLIVQLCRWLVPVTVKASPAQPIFVQQIVQNCSVIVNTDIRLPNDKR